MKKRKFKAPNTVAELLQGSTSYTSLINETKRTAIRSNICELANFLTDPANDVTTAIIITRDSNGNLHCDANEGMHEIELMGMIEVAKGEFSAVFNFIEDDLDG
jgi:hypothetical protein